MSELSIEFDTKPLIEIDQIALLARQDYNLGGNGDWFHEFRGGLLALYSRLNGVLKDYLELHAWLPRIRDPECNLASIFFQMDSALECFTYALLSITLKEVET